MVYEVIGEPPSAGAVQVTVAEESPGVALTPAGAAGAVGWPCDADFRTRVAMSQGVLAPVPAVAARAAPSRAGCSSASSSISGAGEALTRPVQPVPALSVSPNPESAYKPIASSLPAVAAGVAPELTVAAEDVVPDLVAETSSTAVPPAADSPEYSSAAIPISAVAGAVAAVLGLLAAPPAARALPTHRPA